MSRLLESAYRAIEEHGALLVFPIKNQKEPLSLWKVLYPKSEMVWQWDEHADPRVAQLWHLREVLSRSRRVVYSKWYQGRATFFSLSLFEELLRSTKPWELRGPRATQAVYQFLEQNSPISTKKLKLAMLEEGFLSSEVDRALKELFKPLAIVGFGELDDGAFPSLAVGATRLLFEDLWMRAQRESLPNRIVEEKIKPYSKMRRYLERVVRTVE